MKKFLEYFYILSKLSTSIMLFLALIFMIYLLYNSYSSVNKVSKINDDKFLNILNQIKDNQKSINSMTNEFSNQLLIIENIKNNMENKKTLNNDSNKRLKELSSQISILKNNINNLETKIEEINSNESANENIIESQSNLLELKDIVFVKFLNNVDIESELNILYKIINKNNNHQIDKLNIIKKNLYFTYEQALKEFKNYNQKYLKEEIIINKKNHFVNFLLPIMSIKPSSKKSYENKDIIIIQQAEKYFTNKNFIDCKKKLTRLSTTTKYHKNFLKKINVYVELQDTLNLIK